MESNGGKDFLYFLIFVVISFFATIAFFPFGLLMLIPVVLFFLYKIVSILREISNKLHSKGVRAEDKLEE
ncbi:hypothetical protein [Paenibacillus sp. Marseille-Q4541]|uniref:hypothetical protein n=1 Tax=Paenibacillus sp. Marseille-Q4541 TaxID=2831522 RepID=UPI001BAE285E|nr:hypothetical protein [Paenibacillus sp. Marseille-Q4541]